MATGFGERDTMDGSSPNSRSSSVRRSERDLLARVEDLRLHFDVERGVVKALDGVNFDVRQGETVALVGETGCGKTVTARSFTRLVPTPPGQYIGGEVLFRSQRTCSVCNGNGCEECYDTGKAFDDLLSLPDREMQQVRGKRIASVFQDPEEALNPVLTIEEHMAEAILVHQAEDILAEARVEPDAFPGSKYFIRNEVSVDPSKILSAIASLPPLGKRKSAIREVIRDRSAEILKQTQISNPREILDTYPHELSGGQQQRVMIGMALVGEPDLFIADEATTALDVTTQSRILELLDDLQEEYDTGLLYITHDLNLVREIADRVVVMYAGSVAEIGPVEEVYENPFHPYTQGLIDAIPTRDQLEGELRGIDGSIPDLDNPPEGCRFCTRCPEEMEHCSAEDPPIVEEESERFVACHLYPSEED